MEHFTKQFTVIDLLGFFLPGAVLTLACQYYYGNVTEPFVRFFGQGSALLALYFLALSYLAGTLLHEASGLLGRPLWRKKPHQAPWKDPAMAQAYKRVFHKEPPADPAARAEAGREILQFVQLKLNPEKLRLFSAFAAMSRTMVLTTALVLAMALVNGADWRRALAAAAVIGLFFSNWRHYQEQRISYTYTAFLTLTGTEAERPAAPAK